MNQIYVMTNNELKKKERFCDINIFMLVYCYVNTQ